MDMSMQLNHCVLTLLLFGQLHGAVDIGGHLPGGEVTPLLVPGVGVVTFSLQTPLTTRGAKIIRKHFKEKSACVISKNISLLLLIAKHRIKS